MSRSRRLETRVRSLVLVGHRWAGLTLACFLVLIGLTGAILAFRDEIDGWLNPGLHRVAASGGTMLDPFELRQRALAYAPGKRIDEVKLRLEPGTTYAVSPVGVEDHEAGSGHEGGSARLIIDPTSGKLIHRVPAGDLPLRRETLLSFVDHLHFSLALGSFGATLFGLVALLWTIDCFLGFYLTFPATWHSLSAKSPHRSWWLRWSLAWRIKPTASGYRLNFDLHRAGGLWLWPMLLVFAWSGVYFNLTNDVYLPAMKSAFAFDQTYEGLPDAEGRHDEPELDWRDALTLSRRLMSDRAREIGLKILREDSLSFDARKYVFFYTVYSDRDVSVKYAATNLLIDAGTGAFKGLIVPTGRHSGSTITTWLVAIHLAAFGGLAMKLLAAFIGLATVGLSATGIYLWWRRRHPSRQIQRR